MTWHIDRKQQYGRYYIVLYLNIKIIKEKLRFSNKAG